MTRISLAGRFFTAILLAALLAFAPLALTDRALASGGMQLSCPIFPVGNKSPKDDFAQSTAYPSAKTRIRISAEWSGFAESIIERAVQ